MKRIFIVLLIALLLLTACSKDVGKIEDGYTNFGNLKLYQFQRPEKGEEIAVIKTSKGDIKIKLLDEVAPIAVEHFKKWATNGEYDNFQFTGIKRNHSMKVEPKEFNEKISDEERFEIYEEYLEKLPFDKDYEFEISDDVRNFTGAVAFNFFGEEQKQFGFLAIPVNSGLDEEIIGLMEDMSEQYNFTQDIITAYDKIGGIPEADGKVTVFGQIFYGMDMLFEINKMPLDKDGFPVGEPIVIEKIEIVPYEGDI